MRRLSGKLRPARGPMAVMMAVLMAMRPPNRARMFGHSFTRTCSRQAANEQVAQTQKLPGMGVRTSKSMENPVVTKKRPRRSPRKG